MTTDQVVDEESAVMNSSTMCILACIAAVLAVTGPGGGLGQGRGARSACVTARRDAKLPSRSISYALELRTMKLVMERGDFPYEWCDSF